MAVDCGHAVAGRLRTIWQRLPPSRHPPEKELAGEYGFLCQQREKHILNERKRFRRQHDDARMRLVHTPKVSPTMPRVVQFFVVALIVSDHDPTALNRGKELLGIGGSLKAKLPGCGDAESKRPQVVREVV